MTAILKTSATTYLRRFKENTAGVAAIEFAYVMPLMILMSLGVFEVSRAVVMHMRFQRATAMVGDLVSRETQLGTGVATAQAELAGIMRAAEHVMEPYSIASLKIGVTDIRADPANATITKAEWGYGYHGASVPACNTPKAMPASGMITKGNAAIVIESEYTYQPFLGVLVPGFTSSFVWQDRIVNAPREGKVTYGCDLQCQGACPN